MHIDEPLEITIDASQVSRPRFEWLRHPKHPAIRYRRPKATPCMFTAGGK